MITWDQVLCFYVQLGPTPEPVPEVQESDPFTGQPITPDGQLLDWQPKEQIPIPGTGGWGFGGFG